MELDLKEEMNKGPLPHKNQSLKVKVPDKKVDDTGNVDRSCALK